MKRKTKSYQVLSIDYYHQELGPTHVGVSKANHICTCTWALEKLSPFLYFLRRTTPAAKEPKRISIAANVPKPARTFHAIT